MKRFIKENFIFTFLFLISSFLFFSCIQGTLYTGNGKHRFTGTVNDPSEIDFSEMALYNESFNESLRTILPPAADRNYDLYLLGQSETDSLSITKINLSGGCFSLEVTPGIWEFTLYALPQGAAAPATEASAMTAALLVGRTSCDLRNGDSGAVFKLTSDSVTGNGSFKINVYLSNDSGLTSWYETGYGVFIEIRDILSGRIERSTPLDFRNSTESYVKFEDPTMPSGTYKIRIQIIDAMNLALLQESFETISIYKNRTSSGNIYVPKLIASKPEAVQSLSATYIKDSEDAAEHENFYEVHFHWNASNILNERYFELQVADITESTNYGTYGISWGGWNNTTVSAYTSTAEILDLDTVPAGGTRKLFASEGSDYAAGSLAVNSSDAVVWLSLGRKYVARICAVNKAGASEWTEAVLPDGKPGNTVAPFIRDATTGYFVDENGDSADAINRFRLRYYYNGGNTGIGDYSCYWNPARQKPIRITEKRAKKDGSGNIITDGSGNPVVEEVVYIAGAMEYNTFSSATGVRIWDGVCGSVPYQPLAKPYTDPGTGTETRLPLKYWVTGDFSLSSSESTWDIRWRASDATHAPITTATNIDLWAVY